MQSRDRLIVAIDRSGRDDILRLADALHGTAGILKIGLQAFIANVLAERRIAFDEAANGADAVKSLKKNEYTLIFLDLLMPRIDGWGVIDYLRRVKAAKPPRIFIVTGVKNQTLSAADRDIVAGVIYKPLDAGEVDRVIQQSLRDTRVTK